MSTKAFKEHLAQTSPHPVGIEVDRAEGIFIWDKQGMKFYDLVSGLAVTNIGHCHPKVIAAVRDQTERYMHVMPYGEFIQDPQTDLGQKLNELLPDGLDCSYFVNSGTEANEGALKLAKRYTGRREILSFKGSYHGSSHGSLSVTGNEKKKYAFRPLLPEVRFLEFNNSEDLNKIGRNTACVIIEPIQGDAGVRIPSKEFLITLRGKCSEAGALLIFDEIQTGFGRTGTFFAFEQYNMQPDILTIAKAFGGGMPIGAFISSKKIMSSITSQPMLGHITTFGGHPVNCVAALANIAVLQDEDLVKDVRDKGTLFKDLLQHDNIVELRQVGLMMAIQLPNDRWVEKLFYKNLEKGLITFWFLSCKNSLRLAPPLTITNEQIEEVCKTILQCLEEVRNEMQTIE